MKFLIHGNGPNVKTGYGVQVAHLAPRLKALGHDTAISVTYGQQGSIGTWRDITLYPCGYETNGNDILPMHAMHHFGKDPNAGWIITLIDVWCLVNPVMSEFQIAAWCPVDHVPAPPRVLAFFERTGAVPVAMSRFGEEMLTIAGLNPVYIPLSVDTSVMKPTPRLVIDGKLVSAREFLGVPEDAFVVGMVAMNKGWSRDRKGFNEALRAFGMFWRRHQNAVLYMHCDMPGLAEGIDLRKLALHAGVPEHAIVWVDQYAYRIGFSPEMMAAAYTAMDVLLSPSHGEGFCVPLIEAQACGTPVIASDFSSQRELAGPEFGAAGWLVGGQPEWDPSQEASYICPSIEDIVEKLEAAYASDLVAMQETAVRFAAGYDTDTVFELYWKPFLASLEAPADPLPLEREPMGDIAVIVPFMRQENADRLIDSFNATNDGTARLYFVGDKDNGWADFSTKRTHTTYAEKVNLGVESTTEPWVLVVGDDVEFHPGWIEAARFMSERFDVIGTNDSLPGRVRNPDVAAGRHADHFFVRRAYIDEYGACLDGPGVLAPEAYHHWYVDKEIIGLAKARGVFTPCLEAVIEHHHPGYDGREDLRQADPVYMHAVDHAEEDEKTFRSRLPLIEQQRLTRARVS